jgi:hypothetical protein
MIIHYTKHAEEKFFILQKHGRQILKEDITEILKTPDECEKKDGLVFAKGMTNPGNEKWQIVYKKIDTVTSVLTMYPL